MTFLDSSPGFRTWAADTDTWSNRRGDTWHFDLHNRAVRIAHNGVVEIHPDHTGTTNWFGLVLADHDQ